MKRGGVQYRLTRVYLLQLLLISLATVLGVWATANIIEHVLVKEALIKEAEHYWKLQSENPQQPRPNTRHLLGLLQSDQVHDDVPDTLQAMPDGYQRVKLNGQNPIVYIEHNGSKRLYLIFDEQRVTVLAFLFGILPLTGVLLVIYITSFMGWRKSRQLVSPLVQLADTLRDTSVDGPRQARPDLSHIDAEADSEVAVLVSALEAYADRLVNFVERERQFTRDASHELRTPLAVFRANLELLAGQVGDRPQISRMSDTVDDMEAVLETLLTLARTEQRDQQEEPVIVNDMAVNLMERLKPLADRKQIRIQVRQTALVTVKAPEAVLSIVLTNLLRNAINYSGSGEVAIVLAESAVHVRDTGSGMEADELERLLKPFERGNSKEGGHGLGLAIVQRLCERYHWQLDVASERGKGTDVRVRFIR
ncbi:ColS [Alcanivorax hongdengensis A-11-3]|uniref:histidine kinase n=1 Tax=Alcanivorax hongdengensis A-11-3 TaxID=1177179 RepID=L0WFR5_9GAMM|nr:HAMP domain-containing sensor histidine kinase [Alcanivorax hongdengensis]EKF75549.1 ColS [Alcanivorax hongdengensis A-11-3]